ncbi:MAG: tetratricopeptide repeat protein, partial [Gemmatimonadales bacterium]
IADVDDAIREFREAATGPDGAPSMLVPDADFGIARAFDRAGKPDSALAHLQRYLAVPVTRRRDDQMLAAIQKRLGELFDARNNRDSALVHYTAFVDQWKNADPDLQPAVATVKKRIAELTVQEGH